MKGERKQNGKKKRRKKVDETKRDEQQTGKEGKPRRK